MGWLVGHSHICGRNGFDGEFYVHCSYGITTNQRPFTPEMGVACCNYMHVHVNTWSHRPGGANRSDNHIGLAGNALLGAVHQWKLL